MGKIMALDVGSKTIGVAFCEEGIWLAFPGKTLWRQEGKKRDMAVLRQLVTENDVRRIVVGIPLLPDGSRGPQAEVIQTFIATLRGSVRIPIVTQDERLSTYEAEQLLFAVNRPRAEHKRTLDSVAAALILQWHLEETLDAQRPTMNDANSARYGALDHEADGAAPDAQRVTFPQGYTDV